MKIAVISQTADPRRGSEFATGWSVIRAIYLDRRILDVARVDIYVSAIGGNREAILDEVKGLSSCPRFIFVPQVAEQSHASFGRLLRWAWQYRVYRLIRDGGYDVVHQASPNSVAYLNPIFLRAAGGATRVVGPMRIDPRASVSGLYWRDVRVLARHLAIHLKEVVELGLFAYHRRAVRRHAAIHLSPMAHHVRLPNQMYCRETAFVSRGRMDANPDASAPWMVVWSGVGDRHRKNEHLAGRIVRCALEEPMLEELQFLLLGWKGEPPPSSRVTCCGEVPRDQLITMFGSRTIYLCTSLLELNSVLAEEVLSSGGSVVTGPLPSFVGRDGEPGITWVAKYRDPREWVDALSATVRSVTTTGPRTTLSSRSRTDEIIDRVVETILPKARP